MAAGKTYGVAKKASLHAVKVLDDSGVGNWQFIMAALDWIAVHAQKPAVVSMSLGASGLTQAMVTSVDGLVRAGIPVVVAAGNEDDDACMFGPAGVPSAISVAATMRNDHRADFTNYGECVDLFAPGIDIVSAGHTSNRMEASMSGTSMSVPFVAGALALLQAERPGLSAEEVLAALLERATKDAVQDIPPMTKNLLLFVGPVQGPTMPPPDCD